MASDPYFNGSVAAKAGISWGFGGGSAKQDLKKKEDQNAKTIQGLQDKIAMLEAAIQTLKQQGQGNGTTAATPNSRSENGATSVGAAQLSRLQGQKSALEAQLQAKLSEQERQLKQQSGIITSQARQIQQQTQLLETQQRQLDAISSRLQQLEQRSVGAAASPATKPVVMPISQVLVAPR